MSDPFQAFGLKGLPYKSSPLASGFKSKHSKNSSLLDIAAKKQSDRILHTQLFLKKQLAQDLERTMEAQYLQNPDLRGNIYVGIMVDTDYRAEVVPLEEAIASVQDSSAEEARAVFENNPVGYYSTEDFTLSTPQDEKYQDFKKGLQGYFDRNRNLIAYLRDNPVDTNAAENLYKAP